jgi:hypothetical protein
LLSLSASPLSLILSAPSVSSGRFVFGTMSWGTRHMGSAHHALMARGSTVNRAFSRTVASHDAPTRFVSVCECVRACACVC